MNQEHLTYGLGFNITPKTSLPTNCESIRRNKDGYRFHRHRFSIRNGITELEASIREAKYQIDENMIDIFNASFSHNYIS